MDAKSLRAATFRYLEGLGFKPAKSLPPPDVDAKLRPLQEVAARLMALDAVFTWVAFSAESAATSRLEKYIERNALREWMTEEEAEIVAQSREEAHEEHVDAIGWRLENMWALAWVLGFDPEPDLKADQIDEEISRPMVMEFLPGLDAKIEDLLAKASPRSTAEVAAMEYRFYGAHNAVRSAQLGGDTVPPGFHPMVHGGAVHERRHSLSWCLAPGVSWDDVDLST